MKKHQDYVDSIVQDLLGNRWKIVIIEQLMDGTKRFGELKSQLEGITQKVLANNLKYLEEKGLLIREVYAQIPPRVDYSLTAIGESLKPLIDSISEWSLDYANKIKSNL